MASPSVPSPVAEASKVLSPGTPVWLPHELALKSQSLAQKDASRVIPEPILMRPMCCWPAFAQYQKMFWMQFVGTQQ